MSAQVIIENASTSHDIPNDADINTWCQLAAPDSDGDINIRIVDKDEMQTLNKQFRGKDKPTNVLSFAFEAFPEIEITDPIIGDIAICADVVNEEAAEQKKEPTAHWAHIVIHGTLHLLGYDHQNDTDANKMEQLEIQLLQQLGYKNPYE